MKKHSPTLRPNHKKHLLTLLFLYCLGCTLHLSPTQASTEKYRLMWYDDPATTVSIGWVQNGANATVHWGSTDFGTDWTAYPNQKTVDRATNSKFMEHRFARLTGLQPNTAYYFVLKDEDGVSPRFWFKTAPNDPTERLSFIAGGDSRNNQTPRQNANKLVAKLRPHAVLFGGDMTNLDTFIEWQTWFNDWQLTIGADGRMIPLVTARGNHEQSNAVITDMFDVPHPSVYYALTVGGDLVRVYTLNTEIVPGGSQGNWLHQDLEAHQEVQWKIAQYHRPIRPHVADKSEQEEQYLHWATAFYDFGVRLVVECDAHTVKTTHPIRPTYETGHEEGFVLDDCNGTVYVGEGCWGAPLRTNDDDKSWTLASDMFNQFKWIFVDQQKIEVRTIQVDNADDVATVSDNDIFTPPANLSIWNPPTGTVVTINQPDEDLPNLDIITPKNGSFLTNYTNTNIPIEAVLTDQNQIIDEVRFFIQDDLLLTDVTPPFQLDWQPTESGEYNITVVGVDVEGSCNVAQTIQVAVGVKTNSIQVGTASDDATEQSNGTVSLNDGELTLGDDNLVGIRFGNINIPPNATIRSAYLDVVVESFNLFAFSDLTIQGESSDNSLPFATTNQNLSLRDRTGNSTTWSPTWLITGSTQSSPDLQEVVQEVINCPNWNENSALTLFVSGSGSGRDAFSYDGAISGGGAAPILRVEYDFSTAPIPDLSNQNQTLCMGDALTLDAGAGYTSYQWNGQSADNQQEYIVTTGGDYYVEATLDDAQCVFVKSAPINITEETCGNIQFNIQLWLSGVYEQATGLMRTDLYNNQWLPLQQPYTIAPWNYNGLEAVDDFATLPNNMVDWVLVELQETTGNLIAQKAALLLNNGQVVEVPDASTPNPMGVLFNDNLISLGNDYKIIVRHRNHLAIATAQAITLLPINNIDLTDPTQVSGGQQQLTLLPDGVTYGLIAGDMNGNGIINVSDFNQYMEQQGGDNGYFEADINLDGQVLVNDFNLYLDHASQIGVNVVRY